MRTYQEWIECWDKGEFSLSSYGTRDRFIYLLEEFSKQFDPKKEKKPIFFSAPGRTEILGNHTDHQQGKVIAGAIDLDIWAFATPNEENSIRFLSDGWALEVVNLDQLMIDETEFGSTTALIRGVFAEIKKCAKHPIFGLDIFAQSEVLVGSGLSSSAALEILLAVIATHFWADDHLTAVDWAKVGQVAENQFFGKPSGLMDQLACANGSAVYIDFEHKSTPRIETLPIDLEEEGYTLCIVDSGADHADLTEEYATIPKEMCMVAKYFEKDKLRFVEEEDFYKNIDAIRKNAGDRAVLRAIHFFEENHRVEIAKKALKNHDFKLFLKQVQKSGDSSWMYLQNISPTGSTANQEMAIALATAKLALDGEGAYRVHGGGFAGTIQAFVPKAKLDHFIKIVERVLGSGSCHVLTIRKFGGCYCE